VTTGGDLVARLKSRLLPQLEATGLTIEERDA
jgi:hypothetical protein